MNVYLCLCTCTALLFEKEMATYSSILAWKIPWTEEPKGLQALWSPWSLYRFQRIGHDWVHTKQQRCPIPLYRRGINIITYLKGQWWGLSEIMYLMHWNELHKVYFSYQIKLHIEPRSAWGEAGKKDPCKKTLHFLVFAQVLAGIQCDEPERRKGSLL